MKPPLPLLLLSLACAGSARPPPATPAQPLAILGPQLCDVRGPDTVTRAQALEDVDALELLLRRGYAGWEYLARTEGVDWEARLARVRGSVSELPEPSPTSAFHDLLARDLAGIPDCHLSFSVRLGDGMHRARVCDLRPSRRVDLVLRPSGDGRLAPESDAASTFVGCEVEGRAAQVMPILQEHPAWTAVAVAPSREATSARCTFERDGARSTTDVPLVRSEPERDRGPVFESRRIGQIPYLRVRSFYAREEQALQAFVRSAAEVRNAPVVLVDLRGNSGGVDRSTIAWFAGLTSQPITFAAADILESEVTRLGELTWAQCQVEGAREPTVRQIADRDRRFALARDHRMFRTIRHVDGKVEAGTAAERFSGRLVVLIDPGCSSACENFVMRALQLEGTLLVGGSTEGSGAPGDTVSYTLPQSTVRVSLARKLFFDPPSLPAGRAGVGYLPHAWMDPAPGAAERVAACVSEPDCLAQLAAGNGAPSGG